MMTKLANMFVVLWAMAAIGFASTSALADSTKDTGSYDAAYTKRNVQPVPDQEGHALMLTEATGTATSPGHPLDGFSVTEWGIADLRQGNGPQQGYVIFSKGADKQVVRFEGNVSTTLKDGKPNTSMKGSYEIVGGSGALADIKGGGNYSGYFTAEDKYHLEWDGTSSGGPRTN
jgi:hypothetical protein